MSSKESIFQLIPDRNISVAVNVVIVLRYPSMQCVAKMFISMAFNGGFRVAG